MYLHERIGKRIAEIAVDAMPGCKVRKGCCNELAIVEFGEYEFSIRNIPSFCICTRRKNERKPTFNLSRQGVYDAEKVAKEVVETMLMVKRLDV